MFNSKSIFISAICRILKNNDNNSFNENLEKLNQKYQFTDFEKLEIINIMDKEYVS